MKVVAYEPNHKAQILADALVVLMSGGTVVYPTETSYGLGADFFSPHAYRTVYAVKFRGKVKPLPVIVPSRQYAATLVKFTPQASILAERYWPGPLTLVLPFLYGSQWPHHPDRYLALRVSSNPIAFNLSQSFGRPLISTSANISGSEPAYTAGEAMAQFKSHGVEPDLIIDAGEIPRTPPSTIVRVDESGVHVLRKGGIDPLKAFS